MIIKRTRKKQLRKLRLMPLAPTLYSSELSLSFRFGNEPLKLDFNDETRLIISSNNQIFIIIYYDPQKISVVQLFNKPSSQLVTHFQFFF